MKIMVLESFKYNGKEIKAGIVDGNDAELQSLSQFGPVRPATSTEIQEFEKIETAEAKHQGRETAARRK